MLEIYSTNLTVGENEFISFNNAMKKGCTTTLSGSGTINLNKCGVYMVSVNASAETATTIQLYKNGVAQAQAQGTGLNPSFVTLVQVAENNSSCPCSSATSLQIQNSTDTTFTDINCCVTKIC